MPRKTARETTLSRASWLRTNVPMFLNCEYMHHGSGKTDTPCESVIMRITGWATLPLTEIVKEDQCKNQNSRRPTGQTAKCKMPSQTPRTFIVAANAIAPKAVTCK